MPSPTASGRIVLARRFAAFNLCLPHQLVGVLLQFAIVINAVCV